MCGAHYISLQDGLRVLQGEGASSGFNYNETFSAPEYFQPARASLDALIEERRNKAEQDLWLAQQVLRQRVSLSPSRCLYALRLFAVIRSLSEVCRAIILRHDHVLSSPETGIRQ